MILFETARLSVRRFEPSDAEFFFRVNGSAEVMRFIRPAKSRKESDAFFKENLDFYLDKSLLGRFAVFAKTDGSFVGTFSYLFLSGEADFHLGYALVPEAWNLGYATELVRTGVPFFFNNTPHPMVYAIVSPGNEASVKVLKKTGFLFKERSEQSGNPVDVFYINRNLGLGEPIAQR